MKHTQQKNDGTQAITTEYKYDENGNKRFEIRDMGNGNKNVTENNYDGLNRLVDITVGKSDLDSNDGKTTTYMYDLNNNLFSEIDWRGNGYIYEHDPINRLIEKKDRYENIIEKLVYNHNNAQTESYDALNNLTQFDYDKNNRLTEIIVPEGHKLSQQYDDAGNIFTKTNTKTAEKSCTTEHTYDWNNQLLSVKNALGEVTAYTYDSQSNMLTQKDGEGYITTYLYNVCNKLSKKIAIPFKNII